MKQYTSTPGSKQVMRDGAHFADACSPEEAAQIAHAMNEGLARIVVELGECATCKGVGGHQPNCVEKPENKADALCPECRWRGGHSSKCSKNAEAEFYRLGRDRDLTVRHGV